MDYIKFVVVEFPELQEGREAHPVAIVATDDIEEVRKVIVGKGLGVQGTEDGVTCWLAGIEEIHYWYYSQYHPILLNLETFKDALEKKLLNWHNIIEWQRWGYGYVIRKEKIIRIKKNARQMVSRIWEKTGYQIIEEA